MYYACTQYALKAVLLDREENYLSMELHQSTTHINRRCIKIRKSTQKNLHMDDIFDMDARDIIIGDCLELKLIIHNSILTKKVL